MGLRRRNIKFVRPWLIEDKFPASQNVLLDAGAYTVNKEDSEFTTDDLADIASAYMLFVSQNIDHLFAATEFDALALGYEWIKGVREDFWNDLGDKFMPVWHSEYGLDELDAMASKYRRIGILTTEMGDRDLAPQLNAMVRRYGTLLHGLAMTKPDRMREIQWDSVGSTSWINPVKYGETFVWTGKELKWYPKDYKEESRRRHRTLFTNAGFDAAKIADPADTQEVLKLSVWSWTQLVNDINRRSGVSIVTDATELPDSANEDIPDPGVATTHGSPRNTELVHPEPRETRLFPGLESAIRDDDSLTLRNLGTSSRMCDTCFLKDRGCPEYKPGAECAYGLPPGDMLSIEEMEDMALQLQFGRVQFMRLVEDVEGGMADPALSGELDRLTRMIKAKRDGGMFEMTESRRVRVPANQEGAGFMSSLLGQPAGDKLRAVEAAEADFSVAEAIIVETTEREDQ
jgi:hypothetical protein